MLKTITFILTLTSFLIANGQDTRLDRANRAQKSLNFKKAERLYKKELEVDNHNQKILRSLIEIKTIQTNYDEAIYYSTLLFSNSVDSSDLRIEDFETRFLILKTLGQYDEAASVLEQFVHLKTLRFEDSLTSKMSIQERLKLNYWDLLEQILQGPKRFLVQPFISLDSNDVYGAFALGENMVAISNLQKDQSTSVSTLTGKHYDQYIWLNGSDSLEIVNEFSRLNSPGNCGPLCFYRNDNKAIATLNLSRGQRDTLKVQRNALFELVQDNEGFFRISRPIFDVQDPAYSDIHPTLLGDSLLVFASNRPGSIGGFDLYISRKNSKSQEWSEPINLGPRFNTSKNEAFPFFHVNGNLYFSSKGHFGLGGYDIFVTPIVQANEVSQPQNLGKGVNSPADDFSFRINDSLTSGYFSSNRNDFKDEIFSFNTIPPEHLLYICVVRESDSKPVPLSIVELDTLRRLTDTSGWVPFSLKPGKYEFTVSKSGFDGTKTLYTLSEKGFLQNDTIIVPLRGTPKEPVIHIVAPIKFDFDESSIRGVDEPLLDSIALILQSDTNLILNITSHTDCRGTKQYNEILSENRVESTRQYLIQKGGVDSKRISGRGMGESVMLNDCNCEYTEDYRRIGLENWKKKEMELAKNCSEEDHAINRRSEFTFFDKRDTEVK